MDGARGSSAGRQERRKGNGLVQLLGRGVGYMCMYVFDGRKHLLRLKGGDVITHSLVLALSWPSPLMIPRPFSPLLVCPRAPVYVKSIHPSIHALPPRRRRCDMRPLRHATIHNPHHHIPSHLSRPLPAPLPTPNPSSIIPSGALLPTIQSSIANHSLQLFSAAKISLSTVPCRGLRNGTVSMGSMS